MWTPETCFLAAVPKAKDAVIGDLNGKVCIPQIHRLRFLTVNPRVKDEQTSCQQTYKYISTGRRGNRLEKRESSTQVVSRGIECDARNSFWQIPRDHAPSNCVERGHSTMCQDCESSDGYARNCSRYAVPDIESSWQISCITRHTNHDFAALHKSIENTKCPLHCIYRTGDHRTPTKYRCAVASWCNIEHAMHRCDTKRIALDSWRRLWRWTQPEDWTNSTFILG